jgi:hypothetical protein
MNKLTPRVEHLLATSTIRSQARRMLDHALGGGTHFEVDLARLPATADYVVETTRRNYPTLEIPFHSRWGHFRAGGVDRVAKLGVAQDVRARLDLAVVSVLLDAGAGMAWKYREASIGQLPGQTLSKSEGLAVASLHMFIEGAFSSDPAKPQQADAKGLRALTVERLKQGFQVTADNPLVGVEGRVGLLHALAQALESQPEFFGGGPGAATGSAAALPRVGNLVDWYRREARGGELKADQILRGIQLGLGSIWPGRLALDGLNLGDVWKYAPFGADDRDWVPFHKLSQWLSYSLIEPLSERDGEFAGIRVVEADRLTGLPEYRNGGLFVDLGVLKLRDPRLAERKHRPDSDLVIEWRALTIELLERIADLVRERLGLSRERFPLGKVLEGGTWASGRRIAAERRPDGGPPLQIESDGTVF